MEEADRASSCGCPINKLRVDPRVMGSSLGQTLSGMRSRPFEFCSSSSFSFSSSSSAAAASSSSSSSGAQGGGG